MKRNKLIMKKRIISILFIVCNLLLIYSSIMPNIIKANANSNSAEIVVELNTRRVVYAKNENIKKYMASTTKILTAITVIENCNIDDVVVIKKDSVGIEGSSIYLEAGEKLTVKDLLYGLMLRSGNDCAHALAMHCSNDINKFALLMNETAKKIGANNSNFVNPHGLHDDTHYTTAYDLALISCYAMKNDTFREIVSTKSIKIPHTTRNTSRLLINKNKMLKEFSGSTGIKTGYTKKAGRCLVSSCKRNGIEFICVVLNCGPMFEVSKTLLTNAFKDYKNYKIMESDNILKFIDTENGEKIGVFIKNDIILPLTKYEKENIEIMIDVPDILTNKDKNQKEIGKVKIYCQNNLLFEEKIYTII